MIDEREAARTRLMVDGSDSLSQLPDLNRTCVCVCV